VLIKIPIERREKMNQPLLQIETVPISFEYVEKQKPLSMSSVAKLEITRDHNAVDIKSNPVRIKMDSFQKSSGTPATLSYTAADFSFDNQGNATLNLNFEDIGDDVRYAQVGRSFAGMATAASGSKAEPAVNRFPTGEGEQFQNRFPLGNSNISISFDLSGIRGIDDNTTFTPPDLELEVKERAHVVITYVGGPLYFPVSADPNYEPPAEGSFAAEA